MKKRNVLAVVLTGSILAGVFAGCGNINAELLTTKEMKKEDEAKDGKELMQNDMIAEPVSDADALWSFSYHMLKENLDSTNPVLSPLSAYLAMGMVGLGAKGDTLAEFEHVMGVGMQETAETLMQALPNWVVDTSDDKEKSVLEVANSVWLDETMEPGEDWIHDVSDIYGAEAYRGVLSSTSVMKDMNLWVEKKTHSLIKNFLSEPLSRETKMALVNAIYFNGKWVADFDKKSTCKEAFTTTDGKTQQVDMMYDRRTEFYVKNEKMDGVVMDYRYGNMALVALKPTAGQSVREMYEALTYEELTSLLNSGRNQQVKLKLPKFEVEFDQELNETLQNMGIQRAFVDGQADFSGLGQTKSGDSLYISLVRQKAVVKLDEEGTEAAAVTIVETKATSAAPPKDPIEVYFDEPFLYMIMDMESRTPLFMGVMDNPVE